MTQAERITALETQVANLTKTVEAQNQKLDDLLALKAKGQGAFWLATTLFGTSFAVAISYLMSWIK
jgi:hypothetical protein